MARFIKLFGIMIFGFLQSSGQTIIVEKHKDLMIQVSQEYSALMSGIQIQIQQTVNVASSSGKAVHVSGRSKDENLIHIGTPVKKEVIINEDKPSEDVMNVPITVEKEEAVPVPIPVVFFLPTTYPVKGKPKISSLYGYRKDPFTHKRAFHHGIDIEIPANTPIYACANGIVRNASYDRYGGNYIEIDHGNGYKTIYCHLSKYQVEKGDVVGKGQLIGISGNTGRSTGPHIHYQVYFKGKSVNPLSIIYQP